MVDSDMNSWRNDIIMENFPHIQWYVLLVHSINTANDVNIKQQYYQQFNILCRFIIGVYNVHNYTFIQIC